MKKLTLFVVAGLAMVGAFANPKEMKEVVIAGRVINVNEKTSKVVKFNFFNILTEGSQTVKLNERYEFVVRQALPYTQSINAHYLNHFITLYVQPGDSVYLTIDAASLDKNNYQWLTITGDHALESKQLNLTVQYLYTLPGYKYDYTVSPDSMLVNMKTEYDNYLSAFDAFVKANAIGHEIQQWAKRDLKYLVSYNASDYLRSRYETMEVKEEKLKIFNEPFFDMYNADNFQSMWYPYHLTSYVMAISSSRDSTIMRDLEEHRPVDAIREQTKLILREPAGEARDYMLYYKLSSMAKSYPGILDSLPNVYTFFSSSIYRDHLRKMPTVTKPKFKNTPISGISYLKQDGSTSAIPESDVFTFLKSEYPGKVLYIDVYATWCGPCLAEFEKTPAVHESMKGKDVVFVNLCLQSTATAWKKLLAEKHISGENYFFDNDATKLFMGTYKLLGFPSYILVGKNGEVVSTNAPRPSDGGIKEAIEKLLL